jgi:hypothetical protein
MGKQLPYHPFQKILDYYPELMGQQPYVTKVWEDGFTCDVVWEDKSGKLTGTTAGEYLVTKSSADIVWENLSG